MNGAVGAYFTAEEVAATGVLTDGGGAAARDAAFARFVRAERARQAKVKADSSAAALVLVGRDGSEIEVRGETESDCDGASSG